MNKTEQQNSCDNSKVQAKWWQCKYKDGSELKLGVRCNESCTK